MKSINISKELLYLSIYIVISICFFTGLIDQNLKLVTASVVAIGALFLAYNDDGEI